MPPKKQVSWNVKVSSKQRQQQRQIMENESEEDYLKRIALDDDDEQTQYHHHRDGGDDDSSSCCSSTSDNEERTRSKFAHPLQSGNSYKGGFLRFNSSHNAQENNEDGGEDDDEEIPQGPTELILDEDDESKKRSIKSKDIENAIFDDLFLLQERDLAPSQGPPHQQTEGQQPQQQQQEQQQQHQHLGPNDDTACAESSSTNAYLYKCFTCGKEKPQYRCPRCSLRSCSLDCVKSHKQSMKCSGTADAGRFVALGHFDSDQLRRDVRFISDCNRVVSNSQRCGNQLLDGSLNARLINDPDAAVGGGTANSNTNNGNSNNNNKNNNNNGAWRYNYRALPPPLHSLRENAKSRGILCQITSEGMLKRQQNTSRFDRYTSSITWHAEFQFFHPLQQSSASAKALTDIRPFVTIQTRWAHERNLLKDVVLTCWANNPEKLPKYSLGKNILQAKKVFSLNAENLNRLNDGGAGVGGGRGGNRFGRGFFGGGRRGGLTGGGRSSRARSFSRATSSFSKYLAPGEDEGDEEGGAIDETASTVFESGETEVGGDEDGNENVEERQPDGDRPRLQQQQEHHTVPENRSKEEVLKPIFSSTFERLDVANAQAKGKILALLQVASEEVQFSVRDKHHHSAQTKSMHKNREQLSAKVASHEGDVGDDGSDIFIPTETVENSNIERDNDDDAVVEKSARTPPTGQLFNNNFGSSNKCSRKGNFTSAASQSSASSPCNISDLDADEGNDRIDGEHINYNDKSSVAAAVAANVDQSSISFSACTKVKKLIVKSQPFAVFAQVERVYGGERKNEKRFLRLDVDDTICNSLRRIFFVNEFPIFYVVPLVTTANLNSKTSEQLAENEKDRETVYDLPHWAKEMFVEATAEELDEMRAGFKRKPKDQDQRLGQQQHQARSDINSGEEEEREEDDDESEGNGEVQFGGEGGVGGRGEDNKHRKKQLLLRGEVVAEQAADQSEQQQPEQQEEKVKKDVSYVPCKNFLKGRCHAALRGETCPFLHCAANEVPLCKQMLHGGSCARGERCSYSHDASSIRAHWNEMGMPGSHNADGVCEWGRGGGNFRGGGLRGGGRGGFRDGDGGGGRFGTEVRGGFRGGGGGGGRGRGFGSGFGDGDRGRGRARGFRGGDFGRGRGDGQRRQRDSNNGDF